MSREQTPQLKRREVRHAEGTSPEAMALPVRRAEQGNAAAAEGPSRFLEEEIRVSQVVDRLEQDHHVEGAGPEWERVRIQADEGNLPVIVPTADLE